MKTKNFAFYLFIAAMFAAAIFGAGAICGQDKPIEIASADDQRVIEALQSQVEALQKQAAVFQTRLNGCFAVIAPNEQMIGQQPSQAKPVPAFTPYKAPEVKK